jgi:hypothetical protein
MRMASAGPWRILLMAARAISPTGNAVALKVFRSTDTKQQTSAHCAPAAGV